MIRIAGQERASTRPVPLTEAAGLRFISERFSVKHGFIVKGTLNIASLRSGGAIKHNQINDAGRMLSRGFEKTSFSLTNCFHL